MAVKTRDCNLEIKSLEQDGTFEGYGSVFGVVDLYRDIVAKGAFKASLKEWKAKKRLPPLLWQHRGDQPIGRYLEMAEDDHGLYVKGQLLKDEVQQAGEAYALMRANVIRGLSIGYVTRDDSYDEKENVRTIKKADLWEVSLVTFPANEDAQVEAVKATLAGGKLPTIREFEQFLREQGFSRSQAEAIASHGLKHLHQGEPGAPRGDPERKRGVLPDILSALKSIPTP